MRRDLRLNFIRFSAFNTDTAEGRSNERYRLAVLGIFATAISRLAGVFVILVTVHLGAPVLGPERFGIWATFSTLIITLGFLDLGIGNALVNRVAEATAVGDNRQLALVISGGVGWLALIGLLSTIGLMIVAGWIPWANFLKLVVTGSADEAYRAARIFALLFGLNVFSSGLLKILVGQQRTYEAHLIATLAAVLACIATWLVMRNKPEVGMLLIAGFGTQFVISSALSAVLLRARQTFILPFVRPGMRHHGAQLISTGGHFFLLQIATMIGWGGDTVLFAGIAGAANAASFAVVQRLFLFATQPVAILNGPLWASYADARARNDRVFIRNTLRRSLVPSLALGSGLAVALLLSGKWLVDHWTKGTLSASWPLLCAFAVWTSLESGGIAFGIYLNGTGIVREQVYVALLFCLVAVPMKVAATVYFGGVGLVAATSLAYLLVVVGLYSTYFRQRIRAPYAD